MNRRKRDRYKFILRKLGRINFFRKIPQNQIENLLKYLRWDNYRAGEVFFREGEIPRGMYIISKGEVELTINGRIIKTLHSGEIMGEISMLYHVTSKITATARTKVQAFDITNSDFEAIRLQVPEVEKLAREYANREINEQSHFIIEKQSLEAEKWSEHAIEHLQPAFDTHSIHEIQEEAKENSSAPLAIWLGIFLDGLPESFVIGSGFLIILTTKMFHGDPSFSEVVPYTLIAGLFLSNFPEAMSSSIGMRKMGWSVLKVLLLWSSLMIMTAIGAVFGYYFSNSISEPAMIAVEGLAAGAMLTMIAQTMIPEAVHIGGNRVVGLGTLAGYLAAVGFKIFE
jgi:zinc transporter ZupT